MHSVTSMRPIVVPPSPPPDSLLSEVSARCADLRRRCSRLAETPWFTHTRSVTSFALVLALCFWLLAMAVESGSRFRKSQEVIIPLKQDMKDLGERLRRLLPTDEFESECGVSGATIAQYWRVFAMRIREHSIDAELSVVAYNPSYTISPRAARRTVTEESSLCDRGDSITKPRASQITASFFSFDVNRTVTMELINDDAFCFQHYTDVLDGDWPCTSSVQQPRSRVLRFKDVL